MAIKKVALCEDILPNVISIEKIASSPAALSRFEAVLASLKEAKGEAGRKVSPKVDDFLYASAIMMHAAEAALINQETGERLKNADGHDVSGKFVKVTDHKGHDSVKWESADGIQPYKNGNGDIFPEEDLLKAYKDWVGKPLCRDHVSNTVDGIRGIIIDTYYDEKRKRVHALFALDRKNYADLARKVEAGYATSVSMGTAVGRSVCSDCSNVATTEAEYCTHVQSRDCYGEVNLDLSPIELSIVVTGADPGAKIKNVLANLQDYENQVRNWSHGQTESSELAAVQTAINHIRQDLGTMASVRVGESVDINEKASALLRLLGNTDEGDQLFDDARNLTRKFIGDHRDSFANLSGTNLDKLVGVLNHLNLMEEKGTLLPYLFERTKGVLAGGDVQVGKSSDWTLPLTDSDGESLKSDQDLMDELEYTGGPGDPFSNAPQNFASFYTELPKTTNDATNLYVIEHKLAVLAEQIATLRKEFKEIPMTFGDLKKRALERQSYFQGTEDDSALPYPRMGDDEKIRESEDKQMVGDELDTSADNPDENDKKLLQRAKLEQRKAHRNAVLDYIKKAEKGDVTFDKDGKPVGVEGDAGRDHQVQAAKDGKDKDDKKDSKKDDKDSKDKKDSKKDAKDDKKDSKKDSKDDKKDSKADKKDSKNPFGNKKDSKKDSKDKKDDKKAGLKANAFHQGTEDPSVLPYPMLGNQDALRENADKHMLQTGPLGGEDGSVPGDEQIRGGLQRIANKKLSATFFKSANPQQSRWEFFAGKDDGKEKVLSVTAEQVYGDMLSQVVAEDKTLGDFFHSKQYGAKVLKLIRTAGPEGAADEMGVPPVGMPKMAPAEDDVEVEGGDALSELKDSVNNAIEKLDVSLEELKAAVSEEEGVVDLEVNMDNNPQGEQVSEELPPMAPAMSSVTGEDMLEAYAFLTDIVSELSYIEAQLSTSATDKLQAVANSALADANLATTKVQELVKAYKITKAINKAAMGADMLLADDAEMDANCEGPGPEMVLKVVEDDANDYNRETEEMYALDEEDMEKVEKEADEVVEEEMDKHEDEMHAVDFMMDENYMLDEGFDLNATLKTRLAKRKAYRENLIAQAGKYDEIYEGEHGGQGPTLGLEGDDKVENLHEIHDAMLDVATKDQGGPSVREAAEKLDKAIKTGAINANKLNELVALGAVDAGAATYWKTYYSQVDGGSEFADGLVKEFSKTASQDDSDAKIIRFKRAYALGSEAQDKGLIARTATALNDFVDDMVTLPDAMFNSYKNIVAQTVAPSKGVIPQVRGSQNGNNGLVSQASQTIQDSTAPTIENLASILLTK